MLIVAFIFFACAALGGLYLLSFVLKNKKTPKVVAFLHGFIAVIGLLLLIFYALNFSPAPWISLTLFIIAALGGLTLIYQDLAGKVLPKPLAVGHGLLALSGVIMLAIFIWG